MGDSSNFRAKLYDAALEFAEIAERRRNWTMFGADIPWEKIDSSKNTAQRGICIETYCAEELYFPDYNLHGAQMTRSVFGLAWFQVRWSLEESRHGMVFREYLIRSGLRSQEEFDSLEKMIFSRHWTPPFQSRREMACYGALQEGVTYLAYKAQKEKAEQEDDSVLKAIFSYIGGDEAAHAGFYRKIIEMELEEDRAGTVTDFAHVLANFKMPGDGLIPGYHQRLKSGGGGITPRHFMARVILPTLKSLGISRSELKSARAHWLADSQCEPALSTAAK